MLIISNNLPEVIKHKQLGVSSPAHFATRWNNRQVNYKGYANI